MTDDFLNCDCARCEAERYGGDYFDPYDLYDDYDGGESNMPEDTDEEMAARLALPGCCPICGDVAEDMGHGVFYCDGCDLHFDDEEDDGEFESSARHRTRPLD